MNKLFLVLFLCFTSIANAALDDAGEYVLNHFSGSNLARYRVGTELRQVKKVAKLTFNFATYKSGTTVATGAYVLGTLPKDAIVTRTFVDVITGFTSQGTNAGTVALSIQSANDVKTATAVSDGYYANTGLKIGAQDDAIGNFLKLTAQRNVTATVATQKLTAGKLNLVVEYLLSE